MKKKPIVILSFVMCTVLITVLASVSVAWFGNVTSSSNILTISSDRPSGNATILVDGATTDGVKLTPAILKKGIALGGGIDGIDVLDKADIIGTDPDNSPLIAKASTVKISFPYMYVGSPDSGTTTKSCKINLLSATLSDPTARDVNGEIIDPNLMNFIEQFACKMTATDINGEVSSTDNSCVVALIPGNIYNCSVTLNFAYVDELCDPMLLNTGIFFAFQIKTIA